MTSELQEINAYTAKLQSEMWSAVLPKAAVQPTTINGLIVSGMNDVLNVQSDTQAAWWNRIPVGAWLLLWWSPFFLIFWQATIFVAYAPQTSACCCCRWSLSIAFFLIAEIDSPRRGVIQVTPQNLINLSESLRP